MSNKRYEVDESKGEWYIDTYIVNKSTKLALKLAIKPNEFVLIMVVV